MALYCNLCHYSITVVVLAVFVSVVSEKKRVPKLSIPSRLPGQPHWESLGSCLEALPVGRINLSSLKSS